MKPILPLLALLLACHLPGHSQAQLRKGFRAYLEPVYSHIMGRTSILSSENPYDFRIAGSAAALYYRQFDEKLYLGIGLKYLHKSYRHENSNLRFGNQFDPVTGTFDPSIPSGEDFNGIEFRYLRHFIGFPIELAYHFQLKPNTFYLIAGSTPIYMANATNVAITFQDGDEVDRNKNKDRSTDFHKLNAELSMGLGRSILLSESVTLFIESRFSIFALSPTTHKMDKARLYAIGLAAGVNIW